MEVVAMEVAALVLADHNFDRLVLQWPLRRATADSTSESLAWSTSSMQSCTSCTLFAASSSIMGQWASTARAAQVATALPPACHTRRLVPHIRNGKASGSTPAACQLLRTGSMAHSLAASVHLVGHPVVRAPAARRANGIARRLAATVTATAIATMMTTMMIVPAAANVSGATMREAFKPTPLRPSRNQRNCQ